MNKKIFIGYNNVAGNPNILVKTLNKLGYNATYYYKTEHPFEYDDKEIGKKVSYPQWGIFNNIFKINALLNYINTLFFIIKFDVFFFSGRSSLLKSHFDLKIIKLLKKKIIFSFTGCDIRDYRWFLNNYDYRYNICKMCTPQYKEFVNCTIEAKIQFARLARQYGSLIISHPHHHPTTDLIAQYAHFWVPVDLTIPGHYSVKFNLDAHQPLYIIHAPSHTDIKGTKYTEEAISRLQSEGYPVKYERIQNVPNHVVHQKLQECDLVIDQLYAFHGLFALEAMKYSKPVIGYLDDFVVKRLPEIPPVIKADPETIYDVLKEILLNRKKLEDHGRKGRQYLEKYHDCEKVIKNWMDKLWEN